MMLEQGRRRLEISDGYVSGAMGCRKIDVIEFIAMARERGGGSSSKYKTGRGAIRGRFVERDLSERFWAARKTVSWS
jgi:hypothetical protein